jgi:hypothetical protein
MAACGTPGSVFLLGKEKDEIAIPIFDPSCDVLASHSSTGPCKHGITREGIQSMEKGT